MADKEKQDSWEPHITGFRDSGNNSAHACHTQHGFRNRPGWGDKRMENGPKDGHSGRKQSSGGLGSLLGESKPLSSPGGLLYRTEWRSMVTAHG